MSMSYGPPPLSGRISRGTFHAEAAAVHRGGSAVASGSPLLVAVRAAVAAG